MKKKYEMPSIEFLRVVTSKPLMGSLTITSMSMSEEDNSENEEALSNKFGGGLLWGDDDSNGE